MVMGNKAKIHLKTAERRKEYRMSVNFMEREMTALRGYLEAHPHYGSLSNLVRISALSWIRRGGVNFETLQPV